MHDVKTAAAKTKAEAVRSMHKARARAAEINSQAILLCRYCYQQYVYEAVAGQATTAYSASVGWSRTLQREVNELVMPQAFDRPMALAQGSLRSWDEFWRLTRRSTKMPRHIWHRQERIPAGSCCCTLSHAKGRMSSQAPSTWYVRHYTIG
eukprot:3816705-Amphidinium_carterae.1